jgi:hypothetical protein
LAAVVRNTSGWASVHDKVGVQSFKIAFLSIVSINNTIATKGESAVGSAGIGGGITVVGSSITLFASINDTISASRQMAWSSAAVSGVRIVNSVIALLIGIKASVTTFQSASGIAIGIRRTSVSSVIASFVGIDNTVTTEGKKAVHSASIAVAVATKASSIALFSDISDTITAIRISAVGSANIGLVLIIASLIAFLVDELGSVVGPRDWGIVARTASLFAVAVAPPTSNNSSEEGIVVDRVTFFSSERINNTISASSGRTISSAGTVRTIAVVSNSEIAVFSLLNTTIATSAGTVNSAIENSVVGAEIALFSKISNTITANWSNATLTALRRVRTQHQKVGALSGREERQEGNGSKSRSGREEREAWYSSIALFIAVLNSVSASGERAVGTTSIGNQGVVGSSIALFNTESEVDFSVTALKEATRRASIEIVNVTIIALFIAIEDAITASWEAAVQTTSISSVGIAGTIVASLVGIKDSISARSSSAIGSAAVGGIWGGSVVALFGVSGKSRSRIDFCSSISASAVRELRQVINQRFQEGVRAVGGEGEEKRSNHGWCSGSRGSIRSGNVVNQLNFKRKLSTSNGVLRRRVENQRSQNISSSLKSESISVGLGNRHGKVVLSFEESTVDRCIADLRGKIFTSRGVRWRG